MKKQSSSIAARVTLGTLFFLSGVAFLYAITVNGVLGDNHQANSPISKSKATSVGPNAPSPASGSVGPAPGGPSATWHQGIPITGVGPNENMESTCIENVTCETFTLTVNGTQASWAGQRVQVQLSWGFSENEYDIYIHQGANTNTSGTGANSGALVTSATNGPGLTNQTAFIDVAQWGTGTFTVHVAFDVTPVATDMYTGTAMAVPETPAPPPPAPQDTGPKIGYENFEAPGLLVPGSALSSGFVTVEWQGRGAGEPSIGVNWQSTSNSVGGVTNFQSDLETLFVNWDESCSPNIPKATWSDRRAPTSQFIDSDPIGFTDRQTGRVFAAELTLLSPTCKTSFTDSDGLPTMTNPAGWTASQGSGLASAVDHETIGGGPYAPPLNLNPPSPVYPHAVYYCSQDIAAAFCSLSPDGGANFGASIPIYNLTACGGLHGHVKVAPDGTVYVPNRGCGADAAVVVSTDNGVTWAVRQVANATVTNTATTDDPAVGIDNNGTVYYLGALNGTAAMVAVSSDQGQTWSNIYDVGAAYGVKQVAFPAAVAGDAGRAAVAFYGATGGTGDSNSDGFTGVWHLYVAHTFDGGAHWTTSDVTPYLPMQRMGLLRGGGGPMDRNLLDFFDITIDRDGRVQVGYVNGCSGGPCSQAPVDPNGSTMVTGNAYTATASIARQSSGRRMIAANDPTSLTSVPGMPFVTKTRIGTVVQLAWNEADTGNSSILNYQISRGTASNGETPLATISGTQTTYTDNTATDATQTYYYKVVAINAVGSSCGNNEIAAPYVGDYCSGIIIHRNTPSHPEAVGAAAGQLPTPEYLIDYIAVGEPVGTNKLQFTMKVGDLSTVPPSSRWRIVWNSVTTPDEQYYVGMTTDNTAPTPIVSFEHGTIATTSAVVVGVPVESPVGTPDAASHFNADGTITILIDKSLVGSPRAGDLLGAVNGRTFNSGDVTGGGTLERSTLLVDHTFIKGNTDNSYPAATYVVNGNRTCSAGNIAPVGIVSRKTHGSAGTFDIDLPLTGTPGIEDRSGGPSGNHTVVVTFAAPLTSVTNVTVTPGPGGTASLASPTGFSVNNTQITVNLTNVSNAQTLTINLLGVSDGTRTGDVHVPMSVLVGDTNGDGFVNSADIGQTKSQSGQSVGLSNFREDVNTDGFLNSADIALVKSKSGTALP